MAARGEDAPTEAWWSLLDPRANARALGDVQAQALRAAGDLVERLARSVDGPEDTSDDATDRADEGSPRAGPGDAAGLVDVWLEMLSRMARVFDSSRPPGAGQDGHVDLDLLEDAGGRLRLVVRPEHSAAAEIWLHNRSAQSVSALCLHSGEILSPAGVPVKATVTFEPDRIDGMPPRSSRGVEITVTVGADASPGTYRGVLQVEGAPKTWVALELVVDDAKGIA
jgi:hypothetical protein